MRSNVLILLPVIAALSALTLPPARSGVRQSVSTLFLPVHWPVRMVGLAMRQALAPPEEVDPLSNVPPKSLEEARRRNAALLAQIENLTAQLEDLKKLSYQYAQLGMDLRKLVQPAAVTGGPTDQRQTLTINIAGLSNVREKSAVVSPLGFVGQIDGISLERATAKVRLLTDPASRLAGRFARYAPREDGGVDVIRLDTPEQPLVEGDTSGMVARKLPAGSIRAKVKVGDVVLLDDPAFPIPALKGLRLGMVSRIDLPPTDSGFAEVRIEPSMDLTGLREVLVVTK